MKTFVSHRRKAGSSLLRRLSLRNDLRFRQRPPDDASTPLLCTSNCTPPPPPVSSSPASASCPQFFHSPSSLLITENDNPDNINFPPTDNNSDPYRGRSRLPLFIPPVRDFSPIPTQDTWSLHGATPVKRPFTNCRPPSSDVDDSLAG